MGIINKDFNVLVSERYMPGKANATEIITGHD